jgi:8-oxo-dGTP pyrophosphatase MutT (NUDIX family)
VITLEQDLSRVIGVRASVSAVIFDRQGRLLLEQRSDGGQWGLPGGSVEIGESLREAVVREVSEETGLAVTPGRLVGHSSPAFQIVRYPDGNAWHYVNACFECRVRSGQLTTCDETLALAWVTPRRLPRALLPNHRIRIRDGARPPRGAIRPLRRART